RRVRASVSSDRRAQITHKAPKSVPERRATSHTWRSDSNPVTPTDLFALALRVNRPASRRGSPRGPGAPPARPQSLPFAPCPGAICTPAPSSRPARRRRSPLAARTTRGDDQGVELVFLVLVHVIRSTEGL